jgi:iron complex transport system substrate-binding protein
MYFQRIVSLAPSNTETVFSLEAGSRLVGVTDYCNYPEEAKLIEKIGGFSIPDIEKILSLSPDLVLAMDFHQKMEISQRMEKEGISCPLLSSASLLDAPKNIVHVGKILGCEEKAEETARELECKMDWILKKMKRTPRKVRVCYLCSINCVAWRSCYMSKLIELLEGLNIARDIQGEDRDSLVMEICLQDPEVIIFSEGHRESRDLLSFVTQTPLFWETKAYKMNRIYGLRAELICRPGPRAAKGIETLARFIHPELFEE